MTVLKYAIAILLGAIAWYLAAPDPETAAERTREDIRNECLYAVIESQGSSQQPVAPELNPACEGMTVGERDALLVTMAEFYKQSYGVTP